MSLLKARGLVKSYGSRRVVDGVDFEVFAGEIVGLLGPNGAGKTTTFRIACGMIDADAGQVTLGGQDVTNWPMYRRAKDGGIGYLAQESSVFRKLSVQNNLLGVMELLGMDRRTRKRRCEELVDWLGRYNPIPPGTVLSTGTGILVPDEHALQPGDVVTITIDPIGTLRNPVRRLPA